MTEADRRGRAMVLFREGCARQMRRELDQAITSRGTSPT